MQSTSLSSPHVTTKITLVVVPRERFSCTQTSLDSLYQNTSIPFDLVYVDGNSPPKTQRYLEEKASKKGFDIVRIDHYLSPNQARNIGLKSVNTPYVVFIDNDVVVSPGWLQTLLTCAEETQAAIVGPLVCEGTPLHEHIHCAGGESHVITDIKGRRLLREKMYRQGQSVDNARDQLVRTETELIEFHCMLVRTQILKQVGGFDPKMLNTKEHLDFCMTVMEMGETIYFEPSAVVTYVPGPPLVFSDIHFYMLRWSDDWTAWSLKHLQSKWNLAEDGAYFKNRYSRLNWRRRSTLLKPLAQKLTFGLGSRVAGKLLSILEQPLNRYLVYQNKQGTLLKE